MMRNADLDQIYNETTQLLQDGIKTTQQTTEFSLHLAQQQSEQLQEFKNQLHQQRQQQRQLETNITQSNRMVTGLFIIGLATLMIGLGAFGWLTYQIHQQHQQYNFLTSNLNQQLAEVQQSLSTQQTQIATSNLTSPAPIDLSSVSLSRMDDLTALVFENRNQLETSFREVITQLNQQDLQHQKLKDDLNQIKKLLERPAPAQPTAAAKPVELDLTPITRQQQSHQDRLQRLNDAVAQINKQIVDLNQKDNEQHRQLSLRLQQIEKKLDELTQALTESPIRRDYFYRNPQQFNP
ncbi:hypothetical protein THIAE_07675 [Thiomicrospira aerophila AL3]|uniref:Uncharacterized protein n=1 Tax=Thiomicrospira aerophila AL3 TaxID=717772 RepID=W0DZC9_9GAMM|nr:hypothetical protein [Thiomicrospira aerophila]AHF02339.1 hypothetical protein THIAE_07675 [Thiomicrospira aerophila AL3]